MKVVITRDIPGNVLSALSSLEVEVMQFGSDGPTEDDIIEAARDADALISLLSDPLTPRVFEACSDLKIVAQYAVGYDNIDIESAKEHGVVVTNTPGVLTDATADYAFALLLAVARRVVSADRYVRDGRFSRWETDLFLGMELRKKTLGILGMGRIGIAVARRALGFGMHVIYHNRSPANPSVAKVLSAKYVSMDDLLERSDVLSLHCDLNPDSRHVIDAAALERMKSSSILVNTARGAVVDEDALVDALKNGDIAGAGLDVFEDEPKVHPGLLDLENVVLAPHLASATVEARTKMAKMCAESVLAVLNGHDNIPYRVA